MQNLPKKHHFIPEFYSKRWTGTDGKLVRFNRPHLQIVDRNVFPSQVGFQDDLYRITGVRPEAAQQIESNFFRRVDDAAAQTLDLLVNPASSALGIEFRISWARFILSLIHRTPSSFEAFKEGLKILISQPHAETQVHYEKNKKLEDPPLFEDFLKITDPLAVDRSVFSIIPGLIDHGRLGTAIVNMKLGTLDVSKANHSLLLSDFPLITSDGIGNPDGQIIMPLTPYFAFYCAANVDVRNTIRRLSPNQIVRRINRLIVTRARHFVVAQDLRQAEFIKKHFGSSPIESWPEMLHRQYQDQFHN